MALQVVKIGNSYTITRLDGSEVCTSLNCTRVITSPRIADAILEYLESAKATLPATEKGRVPAANKRDNVLLREIAKKRHRIISDMRIAANKEIALRHDLGFSVKKGFYHRGREEV